MAIVRARVKRVNNHLELVGALSDSMRKTRCVNRFGGGLLLQAGRADILRHRRRRGITATAIRAVGILASAGEHARSEVRQVTQSHQRGCEPDAARLPRCIF